MSQMIEVKVPDIGDFESVEVIELLVAEGDTIAVDDSLITVESDKASMEIPSSHSGVVKKLSLNIGDRVSEGDVILLLQASEAQASAGAEQTDSDDAAKAEPQPPATAVQKAEEKKTESESSSSPAEPAPAAMPTPRPAPVTEVVSHEKFVRAHASPAVRKFARELGVDLGQVKGTARNNRITREDVQQYVKQVMNSGALQQAGQGAATQGAAIEPIPAVDFSQWGEVEEVKLSRINVLTGKFLHRNWLNIPHVTQFDEADITDLEAFRKQANEEYQQQGFKLTLVSFLLKAVANALQKYPRFNSSLSADGTHLIRKKYIHIGVAVATADGLVVPVIRDVDKKSLSQLARDLKDVSQKAREKALSPADMQGGCFTISSLGGIGGTQFTPIVNAPEVAILGVSRAKMQPVWNGSSFEPRLICPLSLSYDHRVIDGADGAAFTTYLSRLLTDLRHLLI